MYCGASVKKSGVTQRVAPVSPQKSAQSGCCGVTTMPAGYNTRFRTEGQLPCAAPREAERPGGQLLHRRQPWQNARPRSGGLLEEAQDGERSP